MMHYGVRRLVAINSGNYLYANIDLSKPVHLAAPNNRGKSTLVNALQFLYIDDFNKMKFGRRSHEDTKRHYFGEERSFLVFECLTPSGIQCLLVRGLSNLRGGQFERYVYDGEFQEADYLDDGEIRDFDAVSTHLADRHLTRVKRSDLWQVLAGNLPSGDGKAIPRLNILPIRRRDEYNAFRNVIVRLLSLMNANARTLRQLIIESHARDVGERKIDVAAEYGDEFERAERSEHELNFIRTVADEIGKGGQLRLEIAALTDKLNQAAPLVWSDARRCHGFIEAEKQRLNTESARLEREQQESQSTKEAKLTACGESREKLKTVQREWDNLNAVHEKWSAYSAEFIKEMRDNSERKARGIADIERYLDQATKIDLNTMRRGVADLEKQIAIDRKAFDQWERTAAAELRRTGISDPELDSTFRIANPELLKLIVGDTLTIKDIDATLDRIRAVARGVEDGRYADDTIEADVSGVAGPDAQSMRDPEQLRQQIVLNEQDLREQTSRLKAAEDREKAGAALEELRKDRKQLTCDLAEYDQYATAWSNRADLETQLNAATKQVADIKREISDLEDELKSHAKAAKQIERDLKSLEQLKTRLVTGVRELQKELQRMGLDGSLLSVGEDIEGDQSAQPRSLGRFVESVSNKLSALAEDARRIDDSRSQLERLQDAIAARSRESETRLRYFSDEDEEWTLLIESRDSLPQMEEATANNWDALFTTLGARLNGIVTAVRNIKTAVERINRGLKSYQVSNLRAVDIKVEEEHDTYPAVEALSGADSLFHDRDAVDLAKKRLRRMIETNETIELESLFELRIHIQETDGTWHQAASLDEIGSTGTGMTAKAMIFVQLVRAIAGNEKYRLHFYIDGLGELDDRNLEATAAMAVSKGVIPITADPRLHLEPLAHPEVMVYSLGQYSDGRFYVDSYKTYHARRRVQQAGTTSE